MTRGLPMACGSVLVLTFVLILTRDYPLVGHDFRYFIPKLIDTDLHLRLNGLAVQWWTPSFGGGLPAFANPQHLQYSLVQALLYFTSPWAAILLSTAIVVAVAFWAFYRFLFDTVGLLNVPSVLGAIFFVGNGFYIEHTIVGHLGFQLFPLGAVILLALTDRRHSVLMNASLVALIVGLTIHNAGFIVLLLTAGSLVLTLPVLDLCRPGLIDWMRVASVSAAAFPLALALSGSKIYATLSLMRQIPREMADVYPVSVLQGLLGFVAQLAGAMALVPMFMLGGVDINRIEGALSKLTGASVGVWELDTGLSPIVTVALLIAVARAIVHIVRHGLPAFERRQVLTMGFIAVVVWIGIEATLAKGVIYPRLQPLPILRSLHVNHRVAAIFILPLTLVATMAIDAWYRVSRIGWKTGAIVLLALACPCSYLLLSPRVHLRRFDITQSVKDHARSRHGATFPIERIARVEDAAVLSMGASSISPYEALFGYGNETFATEVHVGDAREISDGHFNMTNPASLVFPELNGVHPFERISVDQRAELDTFLARGQPDWKRPPVQDWLGWLSLVALGVALAVPIMAMMAKAPGDERKR